MERDESARVRVGKKSREEEERTRKETTESKANVTERERGKIKEEIPFTARVELDRRKTPKVFHRQEQALCAI